jgi:heat shock protein HslJ
MKKLIVVLVFTLFAASACTSMIPSQPTSSEASAVPPVAASPEATATQPVVPTTAPTATPEVPGYKDIAYEIEGSQVLLVKGVSEVEAAPGSATKIVTRYFGNEAFGDLNGDGKEDVAFVLTQNPGGSGTFFYIVAALRTDSGYTGLNAVLLGDRVAPQSTSIDNGMVVANYADRKPGEDFTTQPSVGVTKTLQVKDGRLTEVIMPSQIVNRPWKWVRTQMSNGDLDSPIKLDAFTITFGEDGKVTGTTDCNNFFGSYTLQDNQLSFGELASTKMYCEGSQETDFLRYLGEVQSYLIVDNQLVLELKMDSGQIIFE